MIKFKEIWLDINNTYQVSNLGNVRSIDRYIKRKRKGIIFQKGQIIKPYIDSKGYFKIVLNIYRNKKCFRLHRLVAKAFIPNPFNKPQVNHKYGNKSNNNLYNLEWVTDRENKNHAIKNGLTTKGETNGYSVLKEKDVRIIKSSTKKNKELSIIYKVSQSTISSIKTGRNWKHI